MLLPLLLSACGGGASSFNPSSGATPPSSSSIEDEYVFDDATRQSLNEVVRKYENQDLGTFDRYSLIYEGEAESRALYSDKNNAYYHETFDMPSLHNLKGGQYFYKQGDYYLAVQDFEQNGTTYKQYRYLSKKEFLSAEQEAAQNPYSVCPETLKGFIDIKNTAWKDVTFDRLDNDHKGNIHIAIKGKQFNASTGSYYEDGSLSIDVNHYVINSIKCSHNGNYTFDQNAFEITYPDLTSFQKLNEPIKEPGEEDPLSEDEFLVDYDNHRTYYQLLVYSFADSDGDGIGDFKGIADKLDYLKDLGIEGIWLSPILKASSYHGYDIDDYYEINTSYEVSIDGKDYGINYLLRECHDRGIKVLMDLVLNHTSSSNVWCREHRDWYGSDNRFGFPELNYDKQEVREAAKDVGRYWLNRGFDGFRLDAAMWIYNSGSNRHEKNYAFWKEWCGAMKATKPDCYLIGEVLDDNHDLAYSYANAGFDSTFDFNALGNVIQAVNNNNKNYASNTASDIKKATDINKDYILGRALSNHDIGRFNQAHPDSSDKAYYVEDEAQIILANAINALTPGNTFIYYGDELGLKGTCEDTRAGWYYDMNYRTPMPWSNGRTNSVKYFANFHGTGKTTSRTFIGQTVEQMMEEENSIYDCLRKALKLKNSNETLQKGTIAPIANLDNGLNGFDVAYNGSSVRVIYNPSSGNAVDYPLDKDPLYNLGATITNGHAQISSYDLIAYAL